jgi:hypothetical protein
VVAFHDGATSMIDTREVDVTGVLRLGNPHHVDLTRVDHE